MKPSKKYFVDFLQSFSQKPIKITCNTSKK